MRIKAGSPAINAATGTFNQVAKDMDGQSRAGGKDIGADEFNASTTARPLTRADVGPKAP
jgi:poly(beta-D-mannuronate) lyase